MIIISPLYHKKEAWYFRRLLFECFSWTAFSAASVLFFMPADEPKNFYRLKEFCFTGPSEARA
jgi:hypothetical protein